MKLQQSSLLDELKRLREVYEQTKSDCIDQTCQIKSLEDSHTNQIETFTHEQFNYLIKIYNFLQNFHQSNEFLSEKNFTSIDELKTAINQGIHYLSSLNQENLVNPQQQIQLNHFTIYLNKFERKFASLLNNNNNQTTDFDDINENDHDDEFELNGTEDMNLKKFVQFCQDLHEKMKHILREKNEFEEKFLYLEEKRLTYSRWESQMYDILKWINEEKSARSHLKGLANKMAEELDQIRETTSPLLTIGSTSSSMTTAGTNLGHNTVELIDEIE